MGECGRYLLIVIKGEGVKFKIEAGIVEEIPPAI